METNEKHPNFIYLVFLVFACNDNPTESIPTLGEFSLIISVKDNTSIPIPNVTVSAWIRLLLIMGYSKRK